MTSRPSGCRARIAPNRRHRAMTKADQRSQPLLNNEIEKWRLKHGLTVSAACEQLGLQRAKFTEMRSRPKDPIEDKAVCQLLCLYDAHPEVMPSMRALDIRSFMEELGFDPENPSDKKEFALIVGREPAAVYRWLAGEGNYSKPVERLMEAYSRLNATGKRKRSLLKDFALDIADRLGIPDLFKRATWRKD